MTTWNGDPRQRDNGVNISIGASSNYEKFLAGFDVRGSHYISPPSYMPYVDRPVTYPATDFTAELDRALQRHAISDLCVQQGHVINTEAPNKPVEYDDGMLAGYCSRCQCRVVIPQQPGGISSAWVMAVCQRIIKGDFDAELMEDLGEAVEALKADQEAVARAMSTVESVKEILALRLRME